MIIKMIARHTRILGKSQGYLGLPIRDEVTRDSGTGETGPSMVTAWEPTEAEIKCLVEGGTVYLRVLGDGHPPVMIWAGDAE